MVEFFVWLVIILIVVGLFYLWYKGFTNSLKIEREKRDNEKKFKSKLSGKLKHISGLPVTGGAYIDIFYTEDDKIIFKNENTVITLNCMKIRNIEHSTSNGAGGAALSSAAAGKYLSGGTAGGVIGGMTAYASRLRLVISYKGDNEETKFIILNEEGMFPNKLIKEFKKNNKPVIENIEL